MARKDFTQNMVGNFGSTAHELLNISDTVNMVLEVNPDDSSARTALYSIPGMDKLKDLDGSCHGLFTCSRGFDGNPCVYAAYGDSLWVLYEENSTVKAEYVANIPSDTEIRFVENGGQTADTAYVFYVDGSTLHAIPNRLAWGEQRNGLINIPLPKDYRPTHIAYLWGYLVINNAGTDEMNISYQYPLETKLPLYDKDGIVLVDDDGNILYEDNISTDIFQCQAGHLYPDTGFVLYAEWKPDIIEAICSNGTYLYAFGTKSLQKFSYNSSVDAPFVSGSGYSSDIGTVYPSTVVTKLDHIFLVGSVHGKENAVYEITNGALNKISNGPVDNALKDIADTSSAFSYVDKGHLFYVLTLNDSTTLCYDATTQSWTRRESSGKSWRYTHSTELTTRNIFGCPGAVCQFSKDKFTEHDGAPILRERTSGCFTNSLNLFFADSVDFLLDKHQDMDIHYSYSEGGRDFSNMDTIHTESWTDRVTLWNLGLHRILAVRIGTSSDSDFGILGGHLTWSDCDA